MTPETIEKEILIDAPAETVYRVITEPTQISQWFADAAELDAVPGGQGSLTFADRATSQRMAVTLTVQAAEPPHRFAFRWDYPAGEQPAEGNSLLVEFTLTAEGSATRLRVTESGFAALRRPGIEKASYYEAHDKGWDIHLASLQGHVAGQS
ncbi:MAG TPA: SRPBCC family protein [Trebonia sp.]|nr:SRPBCC family protein [Trebonia sp.]